MKKSVENTSKNRHKDGLNTSLKWSDMLILTPNQRLARTYQQQYDLAQSNLGLKTWESLAIFPLNHWVIDLWQKFAQHSLLLPQILLNTFQTKTLWANIIEKKHPELQHLTPLAIEAYQLLKQWQIELDHPTFLLKAESRYFQQWLAEYHRILNQHQWTDPNQIYDLANQVLVKNNNLSALLPKEITLLGFTDFNAQEEFFIKQLAKHKVIVTTKYDAVLKPKISKITFLDEQEEIDAVIKWSLAETLNTENTQKKIACIFPNLSTCKNKITAISQRYHHPHHTFFNISLGKSLLEYPIIQSGLLGLSLLGENKLGNQHQDLESLDKISELHLSPYFNFQSFPSDTSENTAFPRIKNTQTLLKLLDINSEDLLQHQTNSYTPTEWANIFQSFLNQLGFLQTRSLNSKEYQLYLQWQLLIEQFASLTLIVNKISLVSAFHYLHEIAKNTLFQAKQNIPTEANSINILGALEASGLLFDTVWIAGLHANAWPPTTAYNPFLPSQLISPAKINELFYQKMSSQLLTCAQNIILSTPQNINQVPIEPSVLLNSTDNLFSYPPLTHITKIAQPVKFFTLEQINDTKGPALDLTHIQHQSSDIIKNQAACPFRAFAKYRLGAKMDLSPAIGISPIEKGQITHQIMEALFKRFTNQTQLEKLTSPDIKKIILAVLHRLLKQTSARYIHTETLRLENIIEDWINHYEKTRGPFEVVSCEEKVSFMLGNLPLKLRIDRIDKINDQHYIIIDYKTGKTTVKLDPLAEPQLPLYCLAKKDLPVQEVAVAQIRPNDMRFKTVMAQTDLWETLLIPIAENYRAGVALVQPRHGEETCRYCDLPSLCRIKST